MAKTYTVDLLSGDARVVGRQVEHALQGPLQITQFNRPLANLSYNNGLLQGMSATFHPNGRMSAQMPYVNDRLHGLASFYSAEGILQRKANYRNGLLHGEATIHYPNGQLAELEHYRDGVKEGVCRRYHINGKLAARARYLNGQLLDPEQQFANDGRPMDAKGKPISRLRWWWMNDRNEQE